MGITIIKYVYGRSNQWTNKPTTRLLELLWAAKKEKLGAEEQKTKIVSSLF